MPRMKQKQPTDETLLRRINALQERCSQTLAKCEKLANCHLDLDEERQLCQEQLAILAALKKELFPDSP